MSFEFLIKNLICCWNEWDRALELEESMDSFRLQELHPLQLAIESRITAISGKK